MIIYKATHIATGRMYVGQTIRTLKTRVYYHACRGRTHFEQAVQKYGTDAFLFEIIDTANTREELDRKEIEWIERLGTFTPNGFNLTAGGAGSRGFNHGIAAIEKLRRSGIGRTHSAETKRRMSESAKGRKKPYLAERNRSEAMREISSRPPSDETKAKMSAARKCWWERRYAAQ